MNRLRQRLRQIVRFLNLEEGMETVEYAIIVALIVAATLTVLAAIGAWVLAVYQTMQTTVGA